LFKPQQIKASKRACICLLLFFRIGAFQGVAANSNSFFLFLRSVVPICAVVLAALAAVARRTPSMTTSFEKHNRGNSGFQQGIVEKIESAPDRSFL
jgi:hypothetical protein